MKFDQTTQRFFWLILKASKDGDCTTSLDNLFQSLAINRVKNFALLPDAELLYVLVELHEVSIRTFLQPVQVFLDSSPGTPTSHLISCRECTPSSPGC